jgi:hypothetical protein
MKIYYNKTGNGSSEISDNKVLVNRKTTNIFFAEALLFLYNRAPENILNIDIKKVNSLSK